MLNPAIAECQRCNAPLPNEAPVCRCGTQRTPAAVPADTDGGTAQLRKRLEQLREGIGWWISADGHTSIARAGYLLLEVHWVRNQCRALVTDEHAQLLVLDQTGCTLPATARHIAVEGAAAYAVEQLGVRLPVGRRIEPAEQVVPERVVLQAPSAAPAFQLLDGEVLVVNVGRTRYYPWAAVVKGATAVVLPHPPETLRDVQTKTVQSGAFYRKNNDPDQFFSTRIDAERECVLVTVRKDRTAEESKERIRERATYPWAEVLLGEEMLITRREHESFQRLQRRVYAAAYMHCKDKGTPGAIGVRISRDDNGVWIYLKETKKTA